MSPERALEILGQGLRGLRRNKLRSFLTMLGMIFGVGSVITMLSVGAGARAEILARIGELGVRNIILNSVKPPEETKPENTNQYLLRYGLTFADADYIQAIVPTVASLLRVNRVTQRAWYGSRRIEASVLGVQPEHLTMFGLSVRRGRTFTALDDQSRAKVALVRPGFVKQLESVDDPLGQWIYIGGFPFEIIGVLEDAGFRSHTAKALNLDGLAQEIYIPYQTSMSTLGTMTVIQRAGSNEATQVELDQIIVSTTTAEQVFQTAQMLSSALAQLHKKKDYEIVVPLELLQQSEATQKTFNLVMILIASISLLVGGIGIANIMLATITERTREIGVRRALGARRRDISIQFLTETTSIAVVGGLIGCLLGLLGIQGIARYTAWTAIVEPHYVLVALGISCAVGILFGIYPARRAAQMNPITALRHE
ncbi:MAG: FtsX-like permease family protein [Planctomycetes bacterium]|nr:FtsX-like permease family protein [Planctomycetota bacterium]